MATLNYFPCNLIILHYQNWFPVTNILRFEQIYLYQKLYSLFVLPPDSASLESLFELIGAMFQQTKFLAIDTDHIRRHKLIPLTHQKLRGKVTVQRHKRLLSRRR